MCTYVNLGINVLLVAAQQNSIVAHVAAPEHNYAPSCLLLWQQVGMVRLVAEVYAAGCCVAYTSDQVLKRMVSIHD